MNSDGVLRNKYAFITGGAGGIGSACASALLRDGAAVTLMGRRLSALQATRDELNSSVPDNAGIHLFAGDALQEEEVKEAIAFAEQAMGGVNICIPTVGGGEIRPLLAQNAQTFMTDIELNILSCFLAVRYTVPVMSKAGGGSIVIISSDAAKLAFPWLPAYCTAKAGLEGFTRQLAEEVSRYAIRVNAVRPGLTRTACTEAVFADPETVARFAAEKPLGRLGEPADIAAGVRYLAGPESDWVTGQSIAIEGGNELRSAADQGLLVKALFGDEVWRRIQAGIDPAELLDQ